MPDQAARPSRIGALDAPGYAPARFGSVTIAVLSSATKLTLRCAGASAGGIPPAAGLGFGQSINRFSGLEGRISARLGPDEWLILAPHAEAEALEAAIGAALAGRHHALVDVSHRNAAIEVAGDGAELVLAAGCPLDLDPSSFPVGSATRTLIGKAEVVLLKLGEEPRFRIEVWRSYARYLFAFLAEAAAGNVA